MHKRLIALALGAALSFGVMPAAGAVEETETSFVASGPVIVVSPAGYDGPIEDNPLNGQKVTVKFQKKAASGWVTKKTQKVDIDGGVVYAGPTPKFRKGKCRVKAAYPGDAAYAPSSDMLRYDCKTGMLIYQ